MTNPSPWSALRHPLFRNLWLGGFAVNLAIWLQTVGAAWTMTQITSSPLMIALIQTASSLPGVLFGLVGGALADIFDRRRVMIITLVAMMIAAGLLSTLTFLGGIGPWTLLALTFLLGTGFSLYTPSFSTIGSDVVPPDDVLGALSLTSVAFNAARVLGPALGGVIVAVAGAGAVYGLAALFYITTVIFLVRWKWRGKTHALPPERMIGAIRTGLRYLRHTPEFQKHLIHGVLFLTAGSGIWALLPVIAREQMGFSASGYGLLLGCLGSGGVIGALGLGWMRYRWTTNTIATVTGLLFALAVFAIPWTANIYLVCPALIVAGMGWVSFVTTIGVSIQISQPPWIRARAISIFAISVYLSMAIGAALWGSVASHVGSFAAMLCIAVSVLVALVPIRRHPLNLLEASQVTPYVQAIEPFVRANIEPDDGPVLIQVSYQIKPETCDSFIQALKNLGTARHRRGARYWRLYRDMDDPNRFIERFVVDTWTEHLRQVERMTIADRMAEENVREFLADGSKPTTGHFLAEA